MTTAVLSVRDVFRLVSGDYGHGAKAIDRGSEEAAARRANAATRQRLRRGGAIRCVARQTMSTWKALPDEGGIDAPRAGPERGRPARLDAAQLASVRATLLQSPTEHGLGTEL